MNEQEAEELVETLYGENTGGAIVNFGGECYTFLVRQKYVESYRWADVDWFIFAKEDGTYWALPYDVPSTEMQEGQGSYVYSRPELFKVKPMQTTTYVKTS